VLGQILDRFGAEMDGSLVDVGKLAEPATRLIEKVSDTVGWVMEPTQIRRIERAEADAAKIELLSRLELEGIQRRTLERWAVEEVRKQRNMEQITAQALGGVKEDARPDDLDNDWIVNFFDKTRLTSDTKMQQLWARVLAGEANKPGYYSKRAVNALAWFNAEDAEMLRIIRRFVWWLFPINKPVLMLFHSELNKEAQGRGQAVRRRPLPDGRDRICPVRHITRWALRPVRPADRSRFVRPVRHR
jgi:hypothetical protein